MVALLSLLIVKGFFLRRTRRRQVWGQKGLPEHAMVTFTCA
jgi:hypothetical protein